MHRFVSKGQPWSFVARYLWRYRTAYSLIVISIIGAAGASVAARYSMKFLVDAMAQGPANLDAVWIALVIFAGCVGADSFLWRVAGFAGARAFPAVGAELRKDLFSHLLGQSTRYFNNRFSGALASRITTVASELFTVENAFTWNVLPAAAATIGALIGLATVQWQMAAMLTGVAAAVAFGIGYAAVRGRSLHLAFARRSSDVAGEIVDTVTNHSAVRAFANRSREVANVGLALGAEAETQRRALLYIERLRLAHAAIVWILSGAMLAWAIMLWAQGAITTGDAVVCGSFTLALLQSTRDLAVALVEMMHHWSRVTEAVATLTVPHDFPDRPDASAFDCRGGAITFENVSFCHDEHHVILDGIDLRIPAGQRVGIVGPSGAGKSTLLALVQRLYPPSRGRVLIDGQDIALLQQDGLRKKIAVVPQDISLFHRSILENIRYGRSDASDAEVIAAARAAQCDGFIRQLPDGYATLAGDRGVRLSVGQKQRVAIARAILADAPIILLDEATSALDTESELAVQRALSELMRGRTILAVAHRLSTVIGFDRIVVLEEGRVVEDGPPHELRRRNGAFARLWLAQTDETAGNAATSKTWPEIVQGELAWSKFVKRSARG
jgi:ATP-binding cassette subfamily B protein